MDRLPSAEFRKTYPKLEEPVAVTALGRVIGHYVPINSAISDLFVAGLRPGEPTVLRGRPTFVETVSRKAQQAKRDTILRKVNRGKG